MNFGDMKMVDEQYNTAVMVMGFYGGLLQEVVKEYGWEKALEMHGNLGFPMGVSTGQEVKKAAGGKKPDVNLLEVANTQMMTAFGATFKVSEKANSVKYEISRCPMYDGLKASGFSHEQVRKMCVAMSSKEYEGIKSVLPNVIGSAKPRTKPDGICIEEFVIR
jgi:hypothetical protein